MDQAKLRHLIQLLLEGQKLAVLSTSEKGRPYASLVAFGYSGDLRFLYFATTRATRKYANLIDQPRVAFLIDNRGNSEKDFHQAAAFTALGQSGEIAGERKKSAMTPYLKRHPFLKEFVEAPTTAFFEVEIERYIYVSRFQEVFEYRLADAATIEP